MTSLPHATSGEQTRSFWGKIRQNTKSISSQLSNLSLSSEHDGNSEDDTLIHNALVKYYMENNQPFPEWLGVKKEVPKPEQAQNRFANPYTRNQNQGPQHQESDRNPQQEYLRRRPSNSLKDIYMKTESSIQQQGQVQGQFGSRPNPTSTPTQSRFNYSAMGETSPPRPGPARAGSTTSSRIRERMSSQTKSSFEVNAPPEPTGRPKATWGRRG